MLEANSVTSAELIQSEVERLRASSPDTKSLYREVAAALFFKFGITPTANRLYQLVGKGSMTTATAVLARFWRDLRERSQVAYDLPAVPEHLRKSAGELIGQLWASVNQEVRADFDQARAECEAQVHEARATAGTAQSETRALKAELARANERLVEQDAAISERDAELARQGAELEAGVRTVSRLESDLESIRGELDLAKAAFRDDLESVRSAMEVAEERARSGERRALAEIDAERSAAASAVATQRKELETIAFTLEKKDRDIASRDDQIAALRTVIGRLEEKLAAANAQATAEKDRFSQLLARLRPAPS